MNPDAIQLNFVEDALFTINLSLCFIMFGVALGIKIDDFKSIMKNPKSAILGIVSQFILLPFLTFLMVMIFKPHPSIGLGMILIAACPGGNISNFMTSWAKGNAALSVTLTAFATLSAVVLTPFNFFLYGKFFAPDIMSNISVSLVEMLKTVFILLGLPLIAGMLVNHYLPKLTKKIIKPINYVSVLIFLAIVVLAFLNNLENFKNYISMVLLFVFIHNIVAMFTGWSLAKLFKRDLADTKTITIETGIQNSGLGLILIFNFFGGLGGMALVAAWWGIWHIISGLTVSSLWSKKV